MSTSRRAFPSALTASSLGLALGLALFAGSGSARAVYECGGVQDTCPCGMSNFCICCTNAAYGTDHGNCVWYAWHRACCDWVIGLQWCTNANTWDTGAQNNGYPVRTAEPCASTIFVCEAWTTQCGAGDVGHVGWVETAYPNGSIDVREQGCYSWYGVKTRLINAQNASPAMKYIYKPGTSCGTCECTVGATQSQACGNCGTQSRTCGSDCQWGSWSSCSGEGVCAVGATQSQACGNCGTQSRTCSSSCTWGSWSSCSGEGVCAVGATESRACGNCGTQSRTCSSSCTWGSWSACEGEGECAVGATQGCGSCGGTQTCTASCTWGPCEETCSDAAVPPVDASVRPDASIPAADGAPPGSDATAPPQPDASNPGQVGTLVRGGCACDSSHGGDPGSSPVLLLTFLLGLFLAGRRRNSGRSR